MAKKKFSIEQADAGDVADQIGALRATLATMEQNPMVAAAQAPGAIRQLLAVLENINLRLAELE